tara:strand:- start:540 stop:821 length:282 start_codon:yes stop_codon:yes gene_type:complete
MAFFTKEAQELIDYIAVLNEKANGGFMLTSDLAHWAEYGITTKDQLGDYLDDCVAKEQPYNSCDSNDDDYDGGYDPIEPTWDAVSRHDSNEGW